MLTDEQLAILKQINSSIAFDGDDRGEADKLVIEGYVLKDGDLYQLTAIGEKALLDNRARVDELKSEAGDNIAPAIRSASPRLGACATVDATYAVNFSAGVLNCK